MSTDLSTPGRGARRIVSSTNAEPAMHGAVVTTAPSGDNGIVGSTFVAVCVTVLTACLLMAFLLSVRNERPIPAYAIFGSGLFAAVIAAFIVGCVHLAVTDGRRKHHDH